MPSLKVIITGDSTQLKKELAAIDAMAARAGATVTRSMVGGSRGGGNSTAMREFLVLTREISRGNWNRVPGSLSILMSQFPALTALVNPFTAVIVGLAAGFLITYERTKMLTAALTGLKPPDIDPAYIPKHLKAVNEAAEAQRLITVEVQRTTDAYNSMAEAAKRQSDITKEHFEHLRKMNALEQDPAQRASKSVEIDKAERAEELSNKRIEQISLEAEARTKKRQADAIRVSSKEQDANAVKAAEETAKAFEEQVKKQGPMDTLHDKFKATFTGGILPGQAQGAYDAINAQKQKNINDAAAARQAAKDAIDREAANDVLRKQREELNKASGSSAARAAELALAIPDLQKTMDQKNADEEEEYEKSRLANRKFAHGHVNSLQQIGAYAAPSIQIDVAKKSLHHLASIDSKITGGNSSVGSSLTGARFGGAN
jgi:hypothetical protein